MSTTLRHWLAELASDTRVPPIALTCAALLSIVLGSRLGSVPWIGGTLILDLLFLLLWGRPTLRLQAVAPTDAERQQLESALASCLEGRHGVGALENAVVDGAPFPEPATVVSRSPTAATIFVRRDCLAAASPPELRAILARELVHARRRDDVRRWRTTALMLFLLAAGSASLALLRLCLGWRLGTVDLLASTAAVFVGIPTTVFLAQYALHDLEYEADREVAQRTPSVVPALIEWLMRQEAQSPHPFVLIPHFVPFPSERVAHLRRLSDAGARRSFARPLSAGGAIALLMLIAFAVAELIRGRIPDVSVDGLPVTAAQAAIGSARAVQDAVAAFDVPASRSDEDTQQVAVQIEELRSRFQARAGHRDGDR